MEISTYPIFAHTSLNSLMDFKKAVYFMLLSTLAFTAMNGLLKFLTTYSAYHWFFLGRSVLFSLLLAICQAGVYPSWEPIVNFWY